MGTRNIRGCGLVSSRQGCGRLLAALAALGVFLLAGSSVPLSGQVQVALQNLAGVSPQAVVQASETARRTFQLAGIQTEWRTMGEAPSSLGSDARVLHLRLVSSRHRFSANPQALGEALVSDGGGSLAVVYVDRVRVFSHQHRLPFATALAFAAAHELGHLLRGDNHHSQTGLMRTCWDRRDAEAMRSGTLAPDEESAMQMAGKLGRTGLQTMAPVGNALTSSVPRRHARLL